MHLSEYILALSYTIALVNYAYLVFQGYLVCLPDEQPATHTPLIKWMSGENNMEKHMS